MGLRKGKYQVGRGREKKGGEEGSRGVSVFGSRGKEVQRGLRT